LGWGIYCSKKCKDAGQITRRKVSCFICNKEVLKTPVQIDRSKSGKFFCSKSCQTKWRNVQYIGSKHAGFKDGRQSYQSILKREKIPQICSYCGEKDVRVLAVHHIDENHQNNDVKNLAWLCHNCHSLIHYDNVEKQKFLTQYQKQLK
jgi:hypothetical protein